MRASEECVTSNASAERPAPAFIVSFDLEDWHQLVARRVGASSGREPNLAFERATNVILDLLDEFEAKATFFVLGACAQAYPAVVSEVAARGHEIACHGFAHELVYRQSPAAFREDVRASLELIEELTDRRPIGYRAPAFSITRATTWAYDVLADLGFVYDSSQYDSPRIAERIRPIPDRAYRLSLRSGRELWEFPIAVWRVGGFPVPVGGGGYWRMFPEPLLLHALREVARVGTPPVLYFHPYECDPEPLRAELPPSASAEQRARAACRGLYRNFGRGRTVPQLRRLAREFRLVTYEQSLEEMSHAC